MNKLTTKDRGQQIEKLAREYLSQQGLKFISCNYHCRQGEIDLIMHDKDVLVFIEVRFRKHERFGGAIESVDYHKQQRIIFTAQHYLQKHKLSTLCRFDVIAVKPVGNQYQFDWVKNAFEC